MTELITVPNLNVEPEIVTSRTDSMPARSPPPDRRPTAMPMSGVIKPSTIPVTMAVNAPPITTPTARSSTFPRMMNSLNSLITAFSFTPSATRRPRPKRDGAGTLPRRLAEHTGENARRKSAQVGCERTRRSLEPASGGLVRRMTPRNEKAARKTRAARTNDIAKAKRLGASYDAKTRCFPHRGCPAPSSRYAGETRYCR